MSGITGSLPSAWLDWAIEGGYILLIAALIVGLWRAARGPKPSDRLAALKHAWLVSVGIIALVTLQTQSWRVLDLALAFALLGGVVPLASAWAARRRSKETEARHVDAH